MSGAVLLFPITYIFGDVFTEVYGFAETSWEARAAARTEAFNCFSDRASIHWLGGSGRVQTR